MRDLTEFHQLPLRKSWRIEGINLCVNVIGRNELLKPQVNLAEPLMSKLAKHSPKSYGELPFYLFSERVNQSRGKCDVIDATKH